MMSQLNKWTLAGKVSKLVVVITSKDTGENLERWQFDVQLMGKAAKAKGGAPEIDQENPEPRYVTVSLNYRVQLSADYIGKATPDHRRKRKRRRKSRRK